MAKSPPARDELLKALDETLRKVSAQSVLLNDTVAKLVGANPTDLECLDLLGLGGPTTAGNWRLIPVSPPGQPPLSSTGLNGRASLDVSEYGGSA